jgi:hypothetical protein
VLGILGNIPESVSPIQYSHLIPFKPVNASASGFEKPKDWSDFEFARKTLDSDPAMDDPVTKFVFAF